MSVTRHVAASIVSSQKEKTVDCLDAVAAGMVIMSAVLLLGAVFLLMIQAGWKPALVVLLSLLFGTGVSILAASSVYHASYWRQYYQSRYHRLLTKEAEWELRRIREKDED
jgi:membrane protein implicated in regulation of membrane protease activity